MANLHEILIWPLKLTGVEDNSFVRGPGAPWEKCSLALPEYTQEASTRYSEFVFFHPFVQRFLYDSHEDAPMKIFRRGDIKGVRVVLNKGCDPLTLKVERMELYLFPNEKIAILAIEVAGGEMTLGQVQDFQDQFRRAYPPFFKDGSAGLCPAKTQWLGGDGEPIGAESNYDEISAHYEFARNNVAAPVSAHLAWLLEPWKPYAKTKGDGQAYYRQIVDERIPLMSHIAFDNPAALTKGDLVRLAFADESGDSSTQPYGSGFLNDFEKIYCYDRFWDHGASGHYWMNTRFMCCGYAFVIIGDNGGKDGFFTSHLLNHFRHHYFLMGLIAHFQRAALLSFSDEISETVKLLGTTSLSDEFHERIWKLYREFLRFTNMFWFPEVSNQVQPRELFNMWQGHLETRKLYDELLEEIKSVSEYLDAYHERRVSWLVIILTLVMAMGLVLGVWPEERKGFMAVALVLFLITAVYLLLKTGRVKKIIKELIRPLISD